MIPQATVLNNAFGGSGRLATEFHQYQLEALARAKEMAAKTDQQPTLEHYRRAAIAIGTENNLSPSEWNPKSYANLSGHTLEGFTLSDYRNSAAPKRPMMDIYDQDGDGAVNDFYGNVSLSGAKLKNCIVDPATSFNEEISKASELEHVNFNNLQGGDVFTLGQGKKTNTEISHVHIVGAHGGTIRIDGASIQGMTIEGNQVTRFEMQNGAAITNLTANAGIVEIDAMPGTRLEHAQFMSDLSMAGNMRGMKLTNVDFRGNVPADMSGATLTNVTFAEGGMNGLNLSGATITGLSVRSADGSTQAIHSSAQLLSAGVVATGASFGGAEPANPLAAALKGINLGALGVCGGDAADMNTIVGGALPPEVQQAAQAKAEPTVDLRSYYAQMSASGGKPS